MTQVVDHYVNGALAFQLLKATSSCAQHPTVRITAPSGMVILGGGAYVDWTGPCATSPTPAGNLITAMFPNNEGTTWTVSAKDHLVPSPANIVAYCIVARQRNGSPIPSNVYKIVDQTSNVVAHPTQQVNLPEGFSVVGGGARANAQGPGSLLFASNPTPGLDGWVGAAKDHIQSDPASITVWAIGLKKSFLSQAHLTVSVKTSTSAATNHPHLALVIPDFQMTGGGARVNWNSVGNLLTASFPQDRQTWVAEGKDHVQADRTTITAFAVGFQA